MANKLVIFPAGKLTEAQAYKAWADDKWNDVSGEPGGVFTLVREDAFGQWVVAYLGPPYEWNGVVFDEPEGGPAMRADGELADFATWPEEEE